MVVKGFVVVKGGDLGLYENARLCQVNIPLLSHVNEVLNRFMMLV